MKIFHAAFAALLITGSMFLPPAHAQSTPQRSYPTSCTDARVEDRTVCRFADGREQRTSLTDVNGCVSDIGNDNGALTCNHRAANGAVPRGSRVRAPLLSSAA
jgi:hypothetical protein